MKHQIHAIRYFWLVAVLALAGCGGGTNNPLLYAKTPLDKAHVALRSVEKIQQEILTLVSDPAIQPAAKTRLKAVSQAMTLASVQLGTGVVEVESAIAALKEGETTSDRLKIANANLLAWTQTLNDRIADVKKAINEVKAP